MKKVSVLAAAIVMALLLATSAMALPPNTVVIGDRAYSLDLFFQDQMPEELLQAIIAGGDIYFDAGAGFTDAWTGEPMPESVKQQMKNIEYMQADGTVVTYANFDDQEPVPQKKATGEVQITQIGSTTIARIYIYSADVGTAFRSADGSTLQFGEYTQFTATGMEEADIEILDASGNVVGVVTVPLTDGHFEENIKLSNGQQPYEGGDDELIVEDIY